MRWEPKPVVEHALANPKADDWR